jgi:hypothetical protein
MEHETLVALGTVALWVAATMTIVDRFLSLSERFRVFIRKRRRKLATETDETGDDPVAILLPNLPGIFTPALPYLFRREVLVICSAGLLLNYLGLALTARNQSILFLDMTGTALTAFLLGPWWGAIVALLSSSAVNWLLSPVSGGELNIFPWSLVNMIGGLFWGWLARRRAFGRYLESGNVSVMAHAGFLFRFGVLGAIVMSVPGTFVQAAVMPHAPLPLNPDVTAALQQIVDAWEQIARRVLEPWFGIVWGQNIGWAIVNWLETLLRYIPDKTMSAAIALVVLKYGFPLFEQELIRGARGGAAGKPPSENRLGPLALGLVYAPVFAILVSTQLYGGPRFWALWSLPWLIIIAGYVVIRRREPSDAAIRLSRAERADHYVRSLKPVIRRPSYHFCQRLMLITLIASVFIVLALPLLLDDHQKVTINFFGVVYGFLLGIYLMRIAIAQNVCVQDKTGPAERAPTESDGHDRNVESKRLVRR